MANGIWSEDEHDRFLLAIKEFPRGPWSSIAQIVGTRSVRQVQTHTQKYYEKILRRMRGLRKDRKTWARVEHRIDDDILAFCELMKGGANITIAASDLPSIQISTPDNAVPCNGDVKCEAGVDAEGTLEPCEDENIELPPLEEALDFLIAAMEKS